MKILLVDDDAELGAMLSEYLRGEGFDTTQVLTGGKVCPPLRPLQRPAAGCDAARPEAAPRCCARCASAAACRSSC